MIVVLGDVMTDVIVRPVGPLAHGTDCASRIAARPGGGGANVACWLAHLGAAVTFVGRVAARELLPQRDLLRRHGVVPQLSADNTAPTGTAVVVVDISGERSFYTDRGANLNLSLNDLPPNLLDGAEWLHVSGYALYAQSPRGAALALMQNARERGVPFSVDTASAGFLAEAGADAFLEWTHGAALCFSNAAEAALLQAGVHVYPCRVVTRGLAGAEAWSGTEHVAATAEPAEDPETTGCGDAALAGFLFAYVRGQHLRACLHAAMQAGGEAVRTLGGRPERRPAP